MAALLACAVAQAGAAMPALQMKVEPWSATCLPVIPGQVQDCALPKRILTAAFEYTLPRSALGPGDAKVHKVRHQFVGSDLSFELRLYEVFPTVGPRYYQAQIESIAPARGTCMVSVDAAKREWSPFTCVALDAGERRWGLNVTVREP